MKSEYEKNGFYLLQNAVDQQEVKRLITELAVFASEINRYGVRDLMNRVPYVRQLALGSPLLTIAKEILGDSARPVRSVFFDKLPEANWNVAWHQDTSVAIKARCNIPGFGPWSEKQGVIHVEPPEEYLENILTLRLHLDSADIENGVLRVVSGSHKNGRVRSNELIKLTEKSEVVECNAKAGDVLLMNPLLFHSSRKATAPSHRRIIHIEYSAMKLPEPLEWYEYSL